MKDYYLIVVVIILGGGIAGVELFVEAIPNFIEYAYDLHPWAGSIVDFIFNYG